MNDQEIEGIIVALFVTAAGILTAVPVALPAACLWSLVLPGDFNQMPAVIAGFATWFTLWLTVVIIVERKLG